MANPIDLAKKKVEERARARTDKMFLANDVLGYEFCPDVHGELFRQLITFDPQEAWEHQSKMKRRLILWPRSHYKSTAIIVEIIQIILNFPDSRLLLMRGSVKTTKTLFSEIASHFTGEAYGSRLKELFPEFTGSKRELQLTDSSFVTPARIRKQAPQATVTVASPKAIKTGEHYTALFVDDLINESNYRVRAQLEKARENFYMALPLLDNLDCYVYVTGTRYAHGDLYELIVRGESEKQVKEWVISVKTCWTDDGKEVRFPQRTVVKSDGAKKVIGVTREGLLMLRGNDPAMFASQYLNQPASSANQLFDEAKLEVARIDPIRVPYLGNAFIFVDLANGTYVDRDDAVVLTAKTDHLGKMYVVDCVGGQWNTSQITMQIIDMALKHRPVVIFLERSAAGIAFVDYLRLYCQTKGISLPIDFLKSDNQTDAKIIRIQALDAYLRNGRLHFFNTLPCWPKMKDQFVKWSGNKREHDDYPDTVAIMAQYFAHNVPVVTPLSEQQNAFLRIIEQQGTEITPFDQNPPQGNEMGDDFSF